jgi:hypothetical protein
MVKTKIMAKIPMVIPNRLKKDRNLFATSDCQAKNKLSLNNTLSMC